MNALKRSFRQHWVAYMMLIPGLILLITFYYVPMYGLIIAFKNYKPLKGIIGSKWVGLKHFKRFFGSQSFPMLLKNTLGISLYSLCASFPAPIILALLLNEVKCMKFKKVVQTISYMPYFISAVVVCGIVKSFLAYDGLLNAALKALFNTAPTTILSEPKYFQSIIVWTWVWQYVGWDSIIYMAALSAIDPQLYESARIDGCNRLGQAWHITLPGIVPTIMILFILRIGSFMSVSTDNILLLYGPMTYETGDVFGTYIYRLGIKGGQYDLTTAVGLAQTMVNFIMVVLFNYISRKTTEVSLW